MSLATDVARLQLEFAGQLLLYEEVPFVVGEVLAMAVDGFGSEQRILRSNELVQRIRKVRKSEDVNP